MCFCGTMVLRCTFFGLLLTAPLTLVKADDLQPPLPMSTGVVDAPPLGSGCTLPAAGPLQKSLLIVRDTMRTIGPYTVKLPGYATDPNDTAHDSYRPYLIRAKPGDSLRLDLANQMSVVTTNSNGDETAQNFVNTHFHGLVVSPRPYLPCDMPGGYIFDQLAPGQKFQYRIDIPKTVLGIGGAGRQPFPSGLYWFHSHLHGYSKDHLMAGQSGIIAIDPAPAAGSEPTDEDPTSAIRKGTDEQFLVLRDIQLGVPQGQTPDAPSAQGLSATWIHGEDYDTQACRQLLYRRPGTVTAFAVTRDCRRRLIWPGCSWSMASFIPRSPLRAAAPSCGVLPTSVQPWPTRSFYSMARPSRRCTCCRSMG
jgi:FtsP/CotA-like multicopper oxidase with cupredoxin domain